jgi:hypothetical protein
MEGDGVMGRRVGPQAKMKQPRKTVAKTNAESIAATVAALDELKNSNPRASKLIALLRSWLTDQSGYDEETWPQLKKALTRP